MIRIALVDDQNLVRHGVRSLLELVDDFEVVGEAEDGVAGLELIADEAPDLVLLDLRMPRLNGLQVLRALRERDDRTPVIVLTTFDDQHDLIDALRYGARGWLLKDVSFEELEAAIRAVAGGETYVQPAAADLVGRALGRLGIDVGPEPIERLSPREREIMRLIARGLTNRDIADVLAIAEGTVKNHVSHLLTKVGAPDRTRAVLICLQHRLI
jgi:DNA-binding NarL/FixJ family response regulator